MEASTEKTANPTLLPYTTTYQQHVRASTGAIQIHLKRREKVCVLSALQQVHSRARTYPKMQSIVTIATSSCKGEFCGETCVA